MKLAAMLAQRGIVDAPLEPATVNRWHAEALAEGQARRLHRLSEQAGLPALPMVPTDGEDFLALSMLVQCDDAEVIAYAHLLILSADVRAGRVPTDWTHVRQCAACGPVWLWRHAPASVLACPWCWNRVAGRLVPRPTTPCAWAAGGP